MNFDFEEENKVAWTVGGLNDRLDRLVVGEVLRIEGLPNEVYHASKGVSTSKIKMFIDCPHKYKCAYIDKTLKFKRQLYFDFGDAGHTIVLEPYLFESRYVRQPDNISVRNGAAWDLFEGVSKKKGKKILTADHFDAMPKLRQAVDNHPEAKAFTTGGTAEVSYFILDEETGLIVKCRNDYEIRKGGKFIISDLKTAASSNPRFMDSAMKKLGYHIQDAVYTHVTGADNFVFVVIESAEPFVITAPVIMPSELKRLGYLQYRKALRGIKECMETGFWPGYVKGKHVVKTNKFDRELLEQLEGEL